MKTTAGRMEETKGKRMPRNEIRSIALLILHVSVWVYNRVKVIYAEQFLDLYCLNCCECSLRVVNVIVYLHVRCI